MSELKVRVGTPEDVDGVMELAILGSAENGWVRPNPAKLLKEIWPALNRDHGLMGVIGAPGETPEAVILLRTSVLWYSDDEVLEERAIFVHPDFRAAKGGRAARLCEFAKNVAGGLGMPLMIGVLSTHRTAGKVRLYERQFGTPAGAFFL